MESDNSEIIIISLMDFKDMIIMGHMKGIYQNNMENGYCGKMISNIFVCLYLMFWY